MLDHESIGMLRELMEDEFSSLVSLYIKDSDQRLKDIRNEFERGDAEALRNMVHSFKGASSNVCATMLAAQAQEIEDAARNGQLEDLGFSLDSLEQMYASVRSELTTLIL